jgi:hypothetical protein
MRFVRSAVRSEAGRTLLTVLALYLVWLLWASVQARAKIDDEVFELVDARGRVNVELELRFSPERFHILVIQDHGRIRRTIGNVVHARIEPDELRRLARRHWIVEVRPAEDPLAVPASGDPPQPLVAASSVGLVGARAASSPVPTVSR